MATFKQQAMDVLEYIPKITPLIRTQIAKKLGCHPRTVRRAAEDILENRKKGQVYVNQLTELVSNALYLQWFMTTHTLLKGEDKAVWLKRRMKIAQTLEKYRGELRLDPKGNSVVED